MYSASKNESIKTLFESRAALHPERVAASCSGEKLTFAELDRRANQVAHALRRRGVSGGAVAGICMNRSHDMLAALLGVVKAGGAYLPLDPTYPAERLSFMIADSRVGLVLTSGREESWRRLGLHNNAEILTLSWPDGGVSAEEDSRIKEDRDPAGFCYVIYTSGSTGTPKGVLGTEQGMLNRLHWTWERFPYVDGEVGCAKTSLCFLDSFCEIFGPLLRGFPLELVPEEVLKDLPAFVETLESGEVTRLVVVPSLLRALLSNVSDIRTRLYRLKLWTSSGEALMPELVRRFREALPFARLLNLYGSSEVSADCSWYDATEEAGETSVIGRPIPNNELYVLDADHRPVPLGSSGELYVAGAGLAYGYLGRPALTAEYFMVNPFGPPGSRMYRSGDLARCRPDGVLEYLGRTDRQVKIRGFRVELAEIEAVLRNHAFVADATVIGASGKQLLGYVASAAGEHIGAAALREYLSQRLPDYMVPAAIIVLPKLPLTPSGKLDYRALPAPGFTSGSISPTRTPMEQILAEIFAQVLELEHIGVAERFFDLGGDSISSMDLVRRAQAAGLKITSADVFRHQSVQALAAVASCATAS